MVDLSEILAQLKTFQTGHDEKFQRLQAQADEIDKKMQRQAWGGGDVPPLGGIEGLAKALTDPENRATLARSGRLMCEIPTLLETKFVASTGLFSAQPARMVNEAGRFPYRARRLFRVVPANTGSIFDIRSNVETVLASPQSAEGAEKSESDFTFTAAAVEIPTIASWVSVSRQALDDVDGLSEFLRATLLWGLERTAEEELLFGSGVGTNMSGINTTATSFDTTILSAANGWNIVDCLGAAMCQLQIAGYEPDFTILHPIDWYHMQALKDEQSRYVLGDPRAAIARNVWDSRIVVSDRQTAAKFLVGDSSQAVIRQREEARLDISFEHSDNFTKNLATIRVEERFVIQKLRPDAFVEGDLASSP